MENGISALLYYHIQFQSQISTRDGKNVVYLSRRRTTETSSIGQILTYLHKVRKRSISTQFPTLKKMKLGNANITQSSKR